MLPPYEERRRRRLPTLGPIRLAAATLALGILASASSSARAALPNETCEAAVVLDTFPDELEADLRLANPTEGPEVDFVCQPGQSAWYAYDGGPAELRLIPQGFTLAWLATFGGSCEALEPRSCSAFFFDPGAPVVLRVCDDATQLFRIGADVFFGLPTGLVQLRVERDEGPPDLDGDGLDDCTEGCPDDFDPGAEDGDEDGVPDACDNCPEHPNPDQLDADFDGPGDVCDGCPEDFAKQDPGICGCGERDGDRDGDEVVDCLDNCPRSFNADQADQDGDGTGDVCDECPIDPAKADPGVCGCDVSDEDRDGDGVASCIDGCPDDPGKPRPGFCGCGVPDADPDGDGVAACIENCPDVANADQEDLDGDGLGDRCECASGGCIVGGATRLDCSTQLVPPVAASSDGVVRCTDGDGCDRDPAPGRCRIPLALCFAGRTPAQPSCPSVAPRTIDVAASGGPSLDALLAISSLPGARALDERRVHVDPWPGGMQLCTAPFELPAGIGEILLSVSTSDAAGRAIDRDRFRVRCEEGAR